MRFRRYFLLRRTAKSQRRLERFKPKIITFARTVRHDRALLLFSHGAEYSARFGDDDSISVADFYDDYRRFSAQGKR